MQTINRKFGFQNQTGTYLGHKTTRLPFIFFCFNVNHINYSVKKVFQNVIKNTEVSLMDALFLQEINVSSP